MIPSRAAPAMDKGRQGAFFKPRANLGAQFGCVLVAVHTYCVGYGGIQKFVFVVGNNRDRGGQSALFGEQFVGLGGILVLDRQDRAHVRASVAGLGRADFAERVVHVEQHLRQVTVARIHFVQVVD